MPPATPARGPSVPASSARRSKSLKTRTLFGVLFHLPVLHHERHFLQHGDVSERILRYRNQVCLFARFERARFVVDAEETSRDGGRRLDRLQSREKRLRIPDPPQKEKVGPTVGGFSPSGEPHFPFRESGRVSYSVLTRDTRTLVDVVRLSVAFDRFDLA